MCVCLSVQLSPPKPTVSISQLNSLSLAFLSRASLTFHLPRVSVCVCLLPCTLIFRMQYVIMILAKLIVTFTCNLLYCPHFNLKVPPGASKYPLPAKTNEINFSKKNVIKLNRIKKNHPSRNDEPCCIEISGLENSNV